MASPGAAEQMVEQLSSFRVSNTFSDFEIVCQGRSWKVHRLVLSLHSKVLLRACDGEFREAQERRLDLSLHDPEVINCLVSYMYTLDYSRDNEDTKLDAELCILADQYDIKPLTELAAKKCTTYVGYWGESFLMREDKISDLFRVAYSGQDVTRELREAIVKKLVDLKVVADRERLEKFRAAMTAFPDFAIDLLINSAGQMRIEDAESPADRTGLRNYWCPSCGEVNTKDASSMASGGLVACYACSLVRPGDAWEEIY